MNSIEDIETLDWFDYLTKFESAHNISYSIDGNAGITYLYDNETFRCVGGFDREQLYIFCKGLVNFYDELPKNDLEELEDMASDEHCFLGYHYIDPSVVYPDGERTSFRLNLLEQVCYFKQYALEYKLM